MRRTLAAVGIAAGVALVATPDARAQDTAQPLQVGTMAPDFTIPGATRHGVLKNPISLKEYRGKTVVIAFFYRARTRG